MEITIKQDITIQDITAIIQILSGTPYAMYELLSIGRQRTLLEKVLNAIWGVGSAIDVALGVVYFIRRAGVKVKIPKDATEAMNLIRAF